MGLYRDQLGGVGFWVQREFSGPGSPRPAEDMLCLPVPGMRCLPTTERVRALPSSCQVGCQRERGHGS